MKISLFGVSILQGTVYTSTIHFSLLPIHSNSVIARQSDKSEFGCVCGSVEGEIQQSLQCGVGVFRYGVGLLGSMVGKEGA